MGKRFLPKDIRYAVYKTENRLSSWRDSLHWMRQAHEWLECYVTYSHIDEEIPGSRTELIHQHKEIVELVKTYSSEVVEIGTLAYAATLPEELPTAGVILNIRRMACILESLLEFEEQRMRNTRVKLQEMSRFHTYSMDPDQFRVFREHTRRLAQGSALQDGLAQLMNRLDRAKRDLITQIQIANVGLDWSDSKGKFSFWISTFRETQKILLEKLGENNILMCEKYMEYVAGREEVRYVSEGEIEPDRVQYAQIKREPADTATANSLLGNVLPWVLSWPSAPFLFAFPDTGITDPLPVARENFLNTLTREQAQTIFGREEGIALWNGIVFRDLKGNGDWNESVKISYPRAADIAKLLDLKANAGFSGSAERYSRRLFARILALASWNTLRRTVEN
ncbi:hypothetical protein GGR55DRAFT_676723 [Xylaria sp. FL0064]|nr:hypothetical protein GGR55DRAFT_676723 [Xylaria sp. FL0064]